MMATTARLFDIENPERSLLDLADRYGDDQAFLLIGFILDQRGGAGNDAGLVRHLLAKRMVERRVRNRRMDEETARRQLADELGYRADRANQTRSHFYDLVDGTNKAGVRGYYAGRTVKARTMPDDVLIEWEHRAASLMDLARRFGDAEVFHLIGFVRDQRGAGSVAARLRHVLAKRMVERAGGTYDPDREVARQVADSLGCYTPKTRTHFYKLVDGVARSSKNRSYTEDGGR